MASVTPRLRKAIAKHYGMVFKNQYKAQWNNPEYRERIFRRAHNYSHNRKSLLEDIYAMNLTPDNAKPDGYLANRFYAAEAGAKRTIAIAAEIKRMRRKQRNLKFSLLGAFGYDSTGAESQ